MGLGLGGFSRVCGSGLSNGRGACRISQKQRSDLPQLWSVSLFLSRMNTSILPT
jgi:hypothetical protein